MKQIEISEKLKEFFQREFPTTESFDESSKLLETCLADSFSIINAVLFIEKEFGIKFGRADVIPSNFNTINTIASYVEKKFNETK
jgi:acyl carrier protein